MTRGCPGSYDVPKIRKKRVGEEDPPAMGNGTAEKKAAQKS